LEHTALIYFNQTDSSWGVREHQRFVVHAELRRFLRHQTNNGPATRAELKGRGARSNFYWSPLWCNSRRHRL